MLFTLLQSAFQKTIEAGIKVVVLMGVLVGLGWLFAFDGISVARWVGAIVFTVVTLVYLFGAFYANVMIQRVKKDNPDMSVVVAAMVAVLCGVNVWKGTPSDFREIAKVIDDPMKFWFAKNEPMERLVGKDWTDKLGKFGK